MVLPITEYIQSIFGVVGHHFRLIRLVNYGLCERLLSVACSAQQQLHEQRLDHDQALVELGILRFQVLPLRNAGLEHTVPGLQCLD